MKRGDIVLSLFRTRAAHGPSAGPCLWSRPISRISAPARIDRNRATDRQKPDNKASRFRYHVGFSNVNMARNIQATCDKCFNIRPVKVSSLDSQILI